MTESRKEVLVGSTATFQIGSPEDRELYRFIEQCDYGYVKGPEVRSRFGTDEYDSVGCKEDLGDRCDTVPLSSFLPRLSILTWNSILLL